MQFITLFIAIYCSYSEINHFWGLNDIIIFSQYIPDDRGYFFPAIIVHFLLHLFRQFHCYIWAKINGSYHPFYILAVTWKEGCQYVMNLPDALADRLVIGFLFFIFGMDKEKTMKGSCALVCPSLGNQNTDRIARYRMLLSALF